MQSGVKSSHDSRRVLRWVPANENNTPTIHSAGHLAASMPGLNRPYPA